MVSSTLAIIPLTEFAVVYPAMPDVPCGVLQPPEGTTRSMPPLFMLSAAVNVKVRVLPVLFAETEVGETEFVPDPSAALVCKNGKNVKKERQTANNARFTDPFGLGFREAKNSRKRRGAPWAAARRAAFLSASLLLMRILPGSQN